MDVSIKMSTRKAFGEALVLVGEKVPEVVALDADLSKSTFSNLFAKAYPDRFFEMGIAESNMIGVAAGLALSGYIPFACSFACFIAGRFDQIKMSVAYSDASVRIVGTHAGVGIGEDGYSQQGLEDIACMRSLPTMNVFQPADDIECKSMVDYLVKNKGPSYLRLTRQDLVRVHDANYTFKPGIFSLLNQGNDVAIFATGGTVYNALAAALALAPLGIHARVYNASSIKPLDEDAVNNAGRTTKLLVSIEDHNIIGGLGSAIAESLTKNALMPRLVRIGINDDFGESGTPEGLYEKHGLSQEKIVERILREFK
jgi:transketolase